MTGASPQPSRPSTWTRTSKHALVSSRPNEVSNGALYGISTWKTSIASMVIGTPGQHVVAPERRPGAQDEGDGAIAAPEVVQERLTRGQPPRLRLPAIAVANLR